MTIAEMYEKVETEKPSIVYVTGKTSTGKTTFARHLHRIMDYDIISLDEIVYGSVIIPQQLPYPAHVFVEVYKNRDQLNWIHDFIHSAQESIQSSLRAGKQVVIDGAIANAQTLSELLAPYNDPRVFYFHPENITTYTAYLTQRFMQAGRDDRAGLPSSFWEHINPDDFSKFCATRVVAPSLQAGISAYAHQSQKSSITRLAKTRDVFPQTITVDI